MYLNEYIHEYYLPSPLSIAHLDTHFRADLLVLDCVYLLWYGWFFTGKASLI